MIRWTFKKQKTQNYTHGLHQYPARLHPAIVSAVINKFPKTDLVIDPFMGSGTVLVESMLNRKNSLGFDINPFACFLAKVKTRKLKTTPKIQDEIAQILANSEADLRNKVFHSRQIPTNFDVDYWFKPIISKKLAILKHHIKKIPPGKYQDFLKICFSMTARKTSNHRNDVYKNHRMSKEDLLKFNPDVFKIFEKISHKNFQLMDDFSSNVDDTKAIVRNGNSMHFSKNFSKISASEVTEANTPLIITSPPYGDSRTTVAYGEYSGHLASWLDFPKEKIQFLDKIGLGGKVSDLNNELDSKKLSMTIRKIEKNNEYRAQQVYQFFSDFDKSLEDKVKFSSAEFFLGSMPPFASMKTL